MKGCLKMSVRLWILPNDRAYIWDGFVRLGWDRESEGLIRRFNICISWWLDALCIF
jgi:hypothetical protein